MKNSIMLMLCALIAFGAADAFAFGPKPEVVIGPGLNTGRTPYHQNFNKEQKLTCSKNLKPTSTQRCIQLLGGQVLLENRCHCHLKSKRTWLN